MFAATGSSGSPPGSTDTVAGRLGFAAAPTFASMAWISAIGSPDAFMCSGASALVPIDDMTLMYLLMSFFHLSPWWKLISTRSQRHDTPLTQTEGD